MRRALFGIFIAAALCLAVSGSEVRPVKYVFLFIGDGLSIPQRMMTEEYSKQVHGKGLFINSMPYQALTTTSAANSFITDSAASGTAIACGEKTNNGRIGMDSEGKSLESVAEAARNNGRKVGIITSVTLNHATPAAFYGHNLSRGNYYELGLDLIASNFHYFGGGGIAKHDDRTSKTHRGDIYKLALAAGYTVSRGRDEFMQINPGMDKVISVGAKGELPYVIDMPEDMLRLKDYTRQAIELLDNPKGFFIMVEGGKIDWMCHANDAATTLAEVIDLDQAVQVAHEFARKHPEDTLIVVTGDHETGGLTLGFAGTGYRSYIERLTGQKCSRDAMSKRFQQMKNPGFKDVKPLITEMSGLIFAEGERKKGGMHLTEKEEKELEAAFDKQFKDGKWAGKPILSNQVIRCLNNKAGVAWTTGAHTALPVSTTACGVHGELFSNNLDNTDIAKRLKLLVR